MATTRNVLMKDAFNPEEETERDWDIELRDDVKGEVEDKYGKVLDIFVVKESQVSHRRRGVVSIREADNRSCAHHRARFTSVSRALTRQ